MKLEPITRPVAYSDKMYLDYLRILEKVQQNYIERNFVVSRKMLTKRSNTRDVVNGNDRGTRDQLILAAIQEEIKKLMV